MILIQQLDLLSQNIKLLLMGTLFTIVVVLKGLTLFEALSVTEVHWGPSICIISNVPYSTSTKNIALI